MMNLYGRVFTPLQTAHVHVLAYPYECSALSLLDAIATGDPAAGGLSASRSRAQQHRRLNSFDGRSRTPSCTDMLWGHAAAGSGSAVLASELLQQGIVSAEQSLPPLCEVITNPSITECRIMCCG